MNTQTDSFARRAGELLLILTLFVLIMFSTSGCTTYKETFTYYGPDGTNHTLTISHNTFLIYGKANKLATETQTGEFIRTVNASGISVKTDAEAVKALSEGITDAVLKATVKPLP